MDCDWPAHKLEVTGGIDRAHDRLNAHAKKLDAIPVIEEKVKAMDEWKGDFKTEFRLLHRKQNSTLAAVVTAVCLLIAIFARGILT